MKLKKIINFLPFVLIFGAAIFFRFSNLNQTPPSLYSDEVDAGYQAFIYNLCHTDYFGNKFPIHFHSFSDWHTPTLIYSIAFFQQLLHGSDLAIRLPSVILGILTAVSFYFLFKQLFSSRLLALFGFFLAAFSPWLIHYSRSTFESLEGMLLFINLGIIFWLKHLKDARPKYLFISIISFVLSLYFYSTARLFVPLISLTLLLIWPSAIFKTKWRHLLILGGLALLVATPLLIDTALGHTSYRFNYINIFTDPTIPKNVDYLRFEDSLVDNGPTIGHSPGLFSKISHNRPILWLQKFTTNYFSSFSTDFLFLQGDSNLRQGTGTSGYLFYTDLLLIIIGIGTVFATRSKTSFFFLILLVLSPISSSLTRDSIGPHATRLILMLPSLLYFSVLGLSQLLRISSKPLFSRAIVLVIIGANLIQFTYFWHDYNYHYPIASARYWHYNIKQTLAAVNPSLTTYFDDSYEPFLPFYLYYNRYIPTTSCNLPASMNHLDNNFINGNRLGEHAFFGYPDWAKLSSTTSSAPFQIVTLLDKKPQVDTNVNQFVSANPGLRSTTQVISSPIFTDAQSFYIVTVTHE